MLVKAVISDSYKETEIHVCKDVVDQPLKDLMEEISGLVNKQLIVTAENGDKTYVEQRDIISLHAVGQKVFVRTKDGEFTISKKLYELEEELDGKQFVRISKGEIIQLKKIDRLDMSMAGTIRVYLKDGTQTYTSRRNVAKLKAALGI